MPLSSGVQLLAARPSAAEIAALFAVDADMPIVLRRETPRPPSFSDVARLVLLHLRLAALSQVPCEDIALLPQPMIRRCA